MPWVKGQSGNPSGRNGFTRAALNFAARAREDEEQSKTAWSALKCAAEKGDVQAAKEILNRAYGKPLEGAASLADFTTDELIAEITKRVGATYALPGGDTSAGASASNPEN